MKCPYCQQEMDLGNIKCNRDWLNVKWESEENSERKILLVKFFTLKNLICSKIEDVYYCHDCKIILKKVNNQ